MYMASNQADAHKNKEPACPQKKNPISRSRHSSTPSQCRKFNSRGVTEDGKESSKSGIHTLISFSSCRNENTECHQARSLKSPTSVRSVWPGAISTSSMLPRKKKRVKDTIEQILELTLQPPKTTWPSPCLSSAYRTVCQPLILDVLSSVQHLSGAIQHGGASK